MRKPLVGLTTSRIPNPTGRPAFSINEPYSNSVANAGGLPVLIPTNLSNEDLDLLLTRLDGILFTGGFDIDPRQYGNQPHSKVKGIDADRDRMEIHLVQSAVRVGKPFMGICRGFQVINVALGGSLYEDLTEQFNGSINHDNHNRPRDYPSHSINMSIDSHLKQILSCETTQVNSLHHQGVRSLASQLIPTACSIDGLIEAFELPGVRFGLSVQWHPEELQDQEVMRKLFQSFIQSC